MQFHALRTRSVGTVNAQDDLLLKNDFFDFFFKLQLLHFIGQLDKYLTFQCRIFSGLHTPKTITSAQQ